MDKCSRCQKYTFNPCGCERFEVASDWSPAVAPFTKQPGEGDWSEQYATDAEEAAEKFAERSDCEGDYTIIRRGSGEIWVRDAEGAVTRWSIHAEAVPTYSANEYRKPASGGGCREG